MNIRTRITFISAVWLLENSMKATRCTKAKTFKMICDCLSCRFSSKTQSKKWHCLSETRVFSPASLQQTEVWGGLRSCTAGRSGVRLVSELWIWNFPLSRANETEPAGRHTERQTTLRGHKLLLNWCLICYEHPRLDCCTTLSQQNLKILFTCESDVCFQVVFMKIFHTEMPKLYVNN